jgi:hypothetical protein
MMDWFWGGRGDVQMQKTMIKIQPVSRWKMRFIAERTRKIKNIMMVATSRDSRLVRDIVDGGE